MSFLTQLYELDLHIQNYHEGARPFKCSHEGCSKTFLHKHSMMKHQIVHDPGYVRPIPKVCVCSLCVQGRAGEDGVG